MIPLSVLGGVFDTPGVTAQFWHAVASCASVVALWAQARAQVRTLDPVDDLTERVRHPVRWTMRHPVVAASRKLDRRRRAR